MISVVLSFLVWIPAGLSQQSNQLCQKSPYGYPNITLADPELDAKEEDAIKLINYATNYSTIEFLLNDSYKLTTWNGNYTYSYSVQNLSYSEVHNFFNVLDYFTDIPRERNAMMCINDTFYIKKGDRYESVDKMWLTKWAGQCPYSINVKNNCTETGLSAAECAYNVKPPGSGFIIGDKYALFGDPQDFYYAKLNNYMYAEYETIEVGKLMDTTKDFPINDNNKLVCTNLRDIHRVENNTVVGLPIIAFAVIKNVISNCNMSVYNASLQNDGIQAEDAISIKQTSLVQKIIEFKSSAGTATLELYDKKQSKVSTKNYPLKKFKNEKGQIVCKDNEWIFTRKNSKPELVVKQLVVSAREN